MKSVFRDWSDVRVFLAVMRAGSTLAASKVLGISQPTVARRIDVLEHATGLVLFDRDTQGFRPTAEACALMTDAEAMERAAAGFSDTAGRVGARQTRTIRLTSFKDAFNVRLTSVLEEFVIGSPDVTLDLMPRDERLDLVAGEADVAIRVTDKIGEPALICRKIRVVGLSLYASRSYAAKRPLPVTDAGFAGHSFIGYTGRIASFMGDGWLRARTSASQVVLQCSVMKSVEAAVLMGTGIGILPSRFERDHPDVVRCFDLPFDVCPASWLVISPEAWRRPEVKAFAAFFVPRYRAKFEQG